MEIEKIIGRAIFDSRGNPTVEVDVHTRSGAFGRAAVPSGASTGAHEAHELRDGGKKYAGLGVEKALNNISEYIAPLLLGMRVDDQFAIDELMIGADGTENKHNFGANAMLAVSLACAHAAAKARNILLYRHINDIAGNPQMSLPLPMMNILNGGKHAAGSTDIQETMIIPVAASSFRELMRISTEIFHSLHDVLVDSGYATTVGDEGGFAPRAQKGNAEAIELVLRAINEAKYSTEDVRLALDVAASELYEDKKYTFTSEDTVYSSSELVDWYMHLIQSYPIISIEDGLAEDDWEGWQSMTSQLGSIIQLVGDDLLVTNTERLQRAIDCGAGNAILIKPNQIGTLTETIRAIQLAQKNRWRTIISHRSGETEDVTIAHIAVGTGAQQIKTGSLSRSERIAKYNELLRLEELDPALRLARPFEA